MFVFCRGQIVTNIFKLIFIHRYVEDAIALGFNVLLTDADIVWQRLFFVFFKKISKLLFVR